jgi:hypothetical protein
MTWPSTDIAERIFTANLQILSATNYHIIRLIKSMKFV